MDIARVDLFLKNREYNKFLAKASRKLEDCGRITTDLDNRVRALEQETYHWLDEVKRLRIILHTLSRHKTRELQRLDYFLPTLAEIDVCNENIKLNQKTLKDLRANWKVSAGRQIGLTEALLVKREGVRQRQESRKVHLKTCMEQVEKLKQELAQVAEQVHGRA